MISRTIQFFPLIIGVAASAHLDDPSFQELDMLEWTSGMRMAYCADAPLPDLVSPFRRAMAKVATKFCQQNLTACNLRRPVVFGAEQVVLLDGFPRREYGALHFKFYIILPHATDPLIKLSRPLLTREVLSAMLQRYIQEMSNRLGWTIISYERYPRYDSITEFMNLAIIPIVFFSIPLMVFLAYWVSTLRPNMSSDAWLVTGAAGGKNAALRRTMEIIAEQNAAIEREKRLELTKNVKVTGGHDGITATGQLMLNMARMSMASSNPLTAQSPQIIVYPSDSDTASSTIGGAQLIASHAQYPPQHLNPNAYKDRRHSRRQSSIDELKIRRQRRRTSVGLPRKSVKTGSLMLGGFARKK